MKEPKVIERFADNGEHSHYELIDVETGDILWSEEMEALSKHDVIGRSELLLAFGKFIDADCYLLGNGYIEEIVKKFEASNSH